MEKRSLVSIIIPVFNEQENIVKLYRQLSDALILLPFNFEIIFIDDGSGDGSEEIIRRLGRKDNRIKPVIFTRNFGKEIAVTAGIRTCLGDACLIMDADLQHPPELIKEILNFLIKDNNLDIVIASRYVVGGRVLNPGVSQKIKSKSAIILARLFFPQVFKSVKDPLSGYFILRRKVVEGKNFLSLGYKILLEILVKCNYKNVYEVPYAFMNRNRGRSKVNLLQTLYSFSHFIGLKYS